MNPRTALPAAGALGGMAGAIFGGGTGTVTVPATEKITDLPRSVIHGTVAAPNAVVAVIGSAVYALHGGAVDLFFAVPMMLGGLAGVNLGVQLVSRASPRILRLIFAAVLLIVGVRMVLDAAGVSVDALLSSGQSGPGHSVWLWCAALVFGVIVGAWASSLGLGGGLLTVPVLVMVLGTDLPTALGTSLLVMLPNSLASLVAHLRHGTADPAVGVRLALGAAPGAVVGVLVALTVPSRVLSGIFGVFALVMAVRQLKTSRALAAPQE
jgi:uncharacterized membrane protein YfcA